MMQLVVSRDALYHAVSAAQRATATRVIQPILANIMFNAQADGQVTIMGTDMDFTVQTMVPASVSQAGAVTISAKKMAEILAKLPSGSDVTLNAQDGMIHLSCGHTTIDLRTLPAEDFPQPQQLTDGQTVTVALPALVQAVQQTAFAAANFETNNVLGGVFFKLSPGMLEMAATDGSRLARAIQTSSITEVSQDTSAIIPVRVLMEVMKLLSLAIKEGQEAASQPVMITLTDSQIQFKTNEFTVTSRLLEGQYPQYQQLIPAENNIVAYANRRKLISSLELSAVLANERTHVVKLMFDKHSQELVLAANTPEQGDSKDVVPVEYNGEEPLQIAFNYKFLLDALKVIESDDVRMETNGALAPTVFRAKDVDNYLCLVMPVQVK